MFRNCVASVLRLCRTHSPHFLESENLQFVLSLSEKTNRRTMSAVRKYTELSKFTFGKLLSESTLFGEVRLCLLTVECGKSPEHASQEKMEKRVQLVAKIARVSQLKRAYSPEDCLRREIAVLGMCNHPNIISLIGTHEDPATNKLYMFIPYTPLSDLESFVESRKYSKGTPEEWIHTSRFIFRDIALGLNYLHSMKVCHCDIKPENILVFLQAEDESGGYIAKICDLGFASKFQTRTSVGCPRVGTPIYASPNLLDGTTPSNPYKNDVWSLGTVLYFMLYTRTPYVEDMYDDVFSFHEKMKRLTIEYPPIEGYSIEGSLLNLLESLLDHNEDFRPYIEQVLEHEWLE